MYRARVVAEGNRARTMAKPSTLKGSCQPPMKMTCPHHRQLELLISIERLGSSYDRSFLHHPSYEDLLEMASLPSDECFWGWAMAPAVCSRGKHEVPGGAASGPTAPPTPMDPGNVEVRVVKE